MRRVVSTALGVACALVLVACGGTVHSGGAPQGDALDALSAAITATNTSRAAALAALHSDDAAVATADRTDQDALAGQQTGTGSLIGQAAAAISAAASAVTATRAAVGAYAAALTRLQTTAAAAPLSRAQRTAIDTVVGRGRAEDVALRTSAAAYTASFPTYRAVVADLQTWYTHVQAGFFDTAAQAGGAYQVQRTPQAAALARGRAAIAAANGPRRSASAAMELALGAARTALSSLT